VIKPNKLPRIVLDTNVLIAAARSPDSASRWIVEACCAGRFLLLVSDALLREYDFIRERALRGVDSAPLLDELVGRAERVRADPSRHRVPDDPDDAKVLATAADGGACVLVTNDQHLLCLDPCGELRILRPGAARRWLDEE
jgi:putative PIN family toxin of toxin-antitoxin system